MHTILFPTLGSTGDVFPLIQLSRRMNRQGCDCIIIASPHFESMVVEAGVRFLPLGTEQQFQDLTADPRLWVANQAFEVVVQKGIIPFLQPLLDIYCSFPPAQTLIVSPVLLFASHIAHEKYGYPFASLQLQPSLLRSVYAPPVMGNTPLPTWLPPGLIELYYHLLDRFFIDPVLNPALNDFRKQNDLAPVKRVFQNGLFSDQMNICLFPEWFARPQPDWPPNTICTGFIAPPGMAPAHEDILRTFLKDREAPLVFTAGTTMPTGQKFFELAVQSARKLGMPAILLSQDHSQVPSSLPDNCLYLPFYPLEQLLPHAAALVHSGGIGTLAQGITAGIPQVIIPMTNDQPDNADRIQHLGLGDVVMPRHLSVRNLVEKLKNVLNNDDIRLRCREYSQKVNFDKALEHTADLLEQMIGKAL